MCRFLLFKGSDEILLSKLILEPTHSILRQSFDSRLRLDTRRGQNNADGFGIGFYTDPKLGAAPCLFTSTLPAWNCANLHRIASKTASHLIFAHVRASTLVPGSLSEDNCHPFCHGSLMWMHNGGLGGWKHIKRRLGQRLADRWYLGVTGGTDTEWAFALFLDTLERMGHDPSSQPANGFGPTVLRKAMLTTIQLINELTDSIPESIVAAENVDVRSLLNFAVSDGHSVICTRYISSHTDEAASLYYSSGTMWETRQQVDDHDYQMERSDKGADVVLVASEPLSFERENWANVPTNSILTIHKQTVMIHPIMDRYYKSNPLHHRSSTYVQTKGLAANEKASIGSTTPGPSTPTELEAQRSKYFGHSIPFHMAQAQTLEPLSLSRRPSPLSLCERVSSVMSVPPVVRTTDIRTVTDPPVLRASSRKPPAQGNIKKKRASLSALDLILASPMTRSGEPQSPLSPPRMEFGNNPLKIAQYFPELG